MFYVYAIKNDENQIYIGHTSNLEARLKRHNQELSTRKSSYTYKNKKGEWKLFYNEEYQDRTSAKKREKQLKSYRGRMFLKDLINNS